MTRKQIYKKADKIKAKINLLKQQLIELQKEDYLLCDKRQWFTEAEETIGRGKTKQIRLVGRVHWYEYFIDEDHPKEKIKLERSDIVRINGEWTF